MTDDPSKHSFAFNELRPTSGANPQPYIKLLIFFTKREDISEDQFRAWWNSVHADLTLQTAGFEVHCSRYIQFIQTSAQRKALQAAGMEPLKFDGMGELHVRSLDDWLKFMASPAFSEKLTNDGQNFMAGPIQVMVGTDNLVFGPRIGDEGRDGVLKGDSRLKPESKL